MWREDKDDYATDENATAAHFGAKDIGWQALGPAIGFVVLSTCVVALRWWTRKRIVRCVGADDYVILLSNILTWAMVGVIGAAVHEGVGIVHPGSMETGTTTQLIVANNCLWILAVNITKLSILMQYLRIFSGAKTRTCCYVLISALLPAILWGICGGVFLCQPTAKLWNPRLEGHCMSAQRYWLSIAGINIGLDFLVLFLPMPAISSLSLPRKQKISLVLVFLLGFAVCGVSVARLATVLVTSNRGEFVLSGIWAIIWSVIEANVGIICACLLALRPLASHWCPRLMEETELPKHSMRLRPAAPDITVPVWPSEDTALVGDATTPTTLKSKSESTLQRPSLPPSLGTQASRRPSTARLANGREMDIWEMLRHGA